MPYPMWHRTCCARQRYLSSNAVCEDCGQRGTFDGWHLSMHEAMGQYQYIYRLKPIGPHRELARQLLNPLRVRCTRCDGRGIVTVAGGKRGWRGCPQCEGTGGSWTVREEEVEAVHGRILEAFPGAAAPAPVEFLTGAIFFDLENQIIIGALHPAVGVEEPKQPAPEPEPEPAPPPVTAPASAVNLLDEPGCLLLGLLFLLQVVLVYGAS